MKKTITSILILCIVFCLSACSLFGAKTIGKDAALDIALKDAGIDATKAVNINIDLESDRYNKWYEVEFDSGSLEYEYLIQAETGEILSNKAK